MDGNVSKCSLIYFCSSPKCHHTFICDPYIYVTLWNSSDTSLKYCHKAAKLSRDASLEFKRTHCTGTSSSRLYRRDRVKLPKKMEFSSQKYVKITPRIVRFISTGETFSFPFLLNSIYIYFHCTLESYFAPNHYYFYQVLARFIFTSLNHVARVLTGIKGLQQFHLLVQAANVSPLIKHYSISQFVVFLSLL